MTTDRQLSGNELHQRQLLNKNTNAPYIICDGLQTPDNLGSILRVADAIGSRGIILLDSNIDLTHNKISKLSRSTNKVIPIESLTGWDSLRTRFENIYALEITQQSRSIFNENILPCDAILLGHESKGIREDVLALCNGVFHLPMFGQNGSMNISHALAVFLYEWRRQENLILK